MAYVYYILSQLLPADLYGQGDSYHPTHSHVMAATIRRFHQAKQSKARGVTCWGKGSPLREFLHADDLASAAVFALEHWQPAVYDPISYLNVGTGVDFSIPELAELVAVTLGNEDEIHWDTSKPDGTPKKQLDVSRLASLDWRACIQLDQGLRAAVSSFESEMRFLVTLHK